MVKNMKKGFTLIELLTVIVLLGIIAAITVPIIVDTIQDSRIKSCEETVRTIESAAERWHAHNPNAATIITVKELQDEGYLSAEDEIVNPVITSGNNSMNNEEITITYDKTYNQYSYKMRADICEK